MGGVLGTGWLVVKTDECEDTVEIWMGMQGGGWRLERVYRLMVATLWDCEVFCVCTLGDYVLCYSSGQDRRRSNSLCLDILTFYAVLWGLFIYVNRPIKYSKYMLVYWTQ